MDFLDSGGGVVCSDNTSHLLFTEDAETKQNNKYGSSEFLKQERSSSSRTVTTTEDDYTIKDSKLAKTSDGFSSSKANTTTTMMFQHQQHNRSNGSSSSTNNNNPLSDCQQMLSFSSPNNSQTVTMLPYYHHPPSNAFTRNSSGYGNGGMHGVVTGVRGPFTPSQWMELEHQALIYKYITANVPIPPYLLYPIRKALESAGFSTFSGLRPNSLGWGGFHLGLSNSSDPEPGRCRRTDGKKWRCSRDAVVDQKYCERHMNRGRHRSRKPVEPQTVNSVSATTTTTTTGGATSSKLNISSSTSASLIPGGASNNNTLGLSYHHQINHPETTLYLDRSFMSKENVGNTKGFSIVSPSAKDRQYSIPKEQSPYEETSRAEFGLVCDDSLINPLNKSSSLVSCRSYAKSQDINYQENKSEHHPLRQFMDDWPKNQSDQSSVSSWPNIDWHSDRTQLSISIPVLTSGFVSSTSSPTNNKIAASPLSRELEATQMGLGIRNVISEQNKRQGSWIPITWESTMGGPLGEVLHNTNSGLGNFKNTSDLNLMTEGWDRTSSPTGVLQKSSFGSLSNSSAGSSPRAENSKTNEGSSLCNGLLGMNPTLSAM